MSKLIFSKEQIEESCKDIGKKLTKELKNEKKIPVVVGIMKGALNFMMDLVKYIDTEIFLDYIQVSSYNGTKSTGKVILKRDLCFDVKNRTIVLVEDVVDSGISMNYLLDFIKDRHHPKKIILVSLFDKRFRRKAKIKIDYVGKVLTGDDFLLGYGLDFNELGRGIPEVIGIDEKEAHKLLERINND